MHKGGPFARPHDIVSEFHRLSGIWRNTVSSRLRCKEIKYGVSRFFYQHNNLASASGRRCLDLRPDVGSCAKVCAIAMQALGNGKGDR